MLFIILGSSFTCTYFFAPLPLHFTHIPAFFLILHILAAYENNNGVFSHLQRKTTTKVFSFKHFDIFVTFNKKRKHHAPNGCFDATRCCCSQRVSR